MLVKADAAIAYSSSVLIVTPATSHSFTPRFAGVGEKAFNLTCLPDGIMPYVHIDKSTGTLTVDSKISPEASGITGLQVPGLEEVSGGICQVASGKTALQILLLAPWTWPAIHYASTDLRVTVGESLQPVLAQGTQSPELTEEPEARVRPTRFAMACDTDKVFSFEFDELTGTGFLNGYRVLSMDLFTGALALAPDANLTKVFDGVLAAARSSASLQCEVLGYFEWQAGLAVPPISGEINISVLDDTCWKEVVAPPNSSWHRVQTPNLGNEAECRAACRASRACGIYSYRHGSCEFWSPCGLPAKGFCTGIPKAYEKIANCKESDTCLTVQDLQEPVWLYEGTFCPVGLSFQTVDQLEWAYQKSVITVEDSFYLQAPFETDFGQCPMGALWLRRANASWDFLNRTSNYLELYGERVACLSGAQGDLLQAVFDVGTQNITASEKTTDIGKGIQLALRSQSCMQPPSERKADGDEQGDEDDDKGSDSASASSDPSPILWDDPSTETPYDFSLHPCECFPMAWGAKSPVTSQSFQDVPAGSENQYVPASIPIVRGSFVCEQRYLLSPVQYDGSASMDDDACQALCRGTSSCAFYWFGHLGNVAQCRLYSDCDALVRVMGASGTLSALPPDAFLCHRADPEACWAISKRREFLHAQTDSLDSDPTGALVAPTPRPGKQPGNTKGRCLLASPPEASSWYPVGSSATHQ
ncbi:unnamed protein product [Symbiodinium natans]|uniref:Apple domain-containing protein n=1 Tax=Symbiodinium natans TaxID=878477 RepID=A0A812SZ13_9DINO|nr:unnamed protein product [Symbiodinium natans]